VITKSQNLGTKAPSQKNGLASSYELLPPQFAIKSEDSWTYVEL